jgi:hypothetical protein
MGRGLAWTTDQFATLVRLRAGGTPLSEIAAATGRTVESCRNKLSHPSRHPDGPAAVELAELRQIGTVDYRRWTAEKEAELIRMREVESLSWYLLDSHFGREHGSCRKKYNDLKRGTRPAQAVKVEPPPTAIHPQWTEADMTLAQARWYELFVDAAHPRHRVCEIMGTELKRTATAVASRLRTHGASFGLHVASKPIAERRDEAVSQAIIEREARKAAEARRSITANFFGDPPPGYSALDQRRQACTGAPRDSR